MTSDSYIIHTANARYRDNECIVLPWSAAQYPVY